MEALITVSMFSVAIFRHIQDIQTLKAEKLGLTNESNRWRERALALHQQKIDPEVDFSTPHHFVHVNVYVIELLSI